MEVRDPVHGSINILDEQIPLIEHPFFNRLRNIKQLGFSEYAFPGATHTRFIHSIGVMEVANQCFDKILKKYSKNINSQDLIRIKETFKLSCLFHDIGHAPLSHSTECRMPMLEHLKLSPDLILGHTKRQATHEDYTLMAITNSSFTSAFQKMQHKFGIDPKAVASLILGKPLIPDYFLINGMNFFPLLHQLVSSEIDCDRMDYLLRDSYFCGVSYGKYDLDWLIDNLEACPVDGNIVLGISEKAVSTFDDFILSRFHMFIMVYFHYRAVCLEQMLVRYFDESPTEYAIPADIEQYQKHDDHYLMSVLRRSKNSWAKMITSNSIPQKIFENFGGHQDLAQNKLEQLLSSENIPFIKCESSSRLSKYYHNEDTIGPETSIMVSLSKTISKSVNYIPLNQYTTLYEKFSKAHSLTRIHCDLSSLSSSMAKAIMDLC